MSDWFTKIIDIAKVPTKFIASLCITSGLILLIPSTFQKKLFLDKFVDNYGIYIGVTLLFTFAILFSEGIIWMSRNYRQSKAKAKADIETIQSLNDLDSKELAVLREFFIQDQNTLQLPISHPVVAGLLQKRILEQVGSLGEQSLIGPIMSLTISESVKSLITMEAVGLHNRQPTRDEIEWVRNNRPDFVKQLERRKSLYDW